MSKQAWRFVLRKNRLKKREQKHEERGETETTKRREEKVRGTAQESFKP